jgi:thiol-disulfide isomerase/thioredoxin
MMRTLLLIICLLHSYTIYASEIRSLETRESEVSYTHFPANGNRLFIWIAPEAGLLENERQAAETLSRQGIEVWYPDLFEANFLAVVQSSMDRIPATQIADMLTAASKTGKSIYFVTSGRGVIPVLRGIRAWQLDNPASTQFRGLIALSGKLFVETPDPGKAAELMPIAQASNVPVYWLQPDKSPWWWKLNITIPALEKAGSSVFVQRMRDVRDRFYYRPDATEIEHGLSKKLPGLLVNAADMLDTQQHARKPAKQAAPERYASDTKKDRVLQTYRGNPLPPPLSLQGMDNKQHAITQLKGQVVLVNFWATWCPPCVHEMPSMQRLQDHYKDKPFTIVGVNMAEDKTTIERFLKEKVSIDFPIWLDLDGTALKNWNVFAFPTTYVIGKQGNIRYALFGGREWDQADITRVIDALIDE